MPPSNYEALVHYEDTIKKGVPLERIRRFLPAGMSATLQTLFGNRAVQVWGSRNTPRNRGTFDRMRVGDDVLIVEDRTIRLLGIVAAKIHHPELARELWKNLLSGSDEAWELVYFIADGKQIDLDFRAFCGVIGYSEEFRPRGFSAVAEENLAAFYDQYDDLYDVLVRLRQDETPQKKPALLPPLLMPPAVHDAAVEVTEEDVEEILKSPEISDHLRMQWKLIQLGIKAGEKVWIPPGDQTRIRKMYQYDTFEPKFTTGIDLPTGFFDNIDVIWKAQFRIDAAFEVENSTAIYSGLLRFADLSIVAPNTVYPLFIVAPADRRNQVRSQLERPVFNQLHMDRKVRFLPYEAVDEIEKFFAGTAAGLNIDLVQSKAEKLI